MKKVENVEPMKAIEGNFANRGLVASVAIGVSLGVLGDYNRPNVFINDDISRIVIRRGFGRYTERMHEKIRLGLLPTLNFCFDSHLEDGDIVIERV